MEGWVAQNPKICPLAQEASKNEKKNLAKSDRPTFPFFLFF
jgi:hypothetical protein